jgi:CubicO group peptidase (beta-lactamase class C family)
MAIIFFNRNISDECHQKMKDLSAAGDDTVWMAFPPGGGNRWSIVSKSGAYFNRNIPEECHQKMHDLSQNGAKIIRVAFPPQGGWSIVNDKGVYYNRNIPDECHQKMHDLSQNGAKIVSVAFPPQGGNSWSIVNDKGVYYNRNIPDECHQKMQVLSQNGEKIICVAFPPQGGNSWSIVNDQGGYYNRNIPEEAHMFMGYFSEVYGPIKIISFDMDGSGWSITAAVTLAEKVCDATQCVLIADVYRNIAARLNNKVVGYACTVGSSLLGAYSHGEARTNANAPSRMFLPSTKIPVASVSKVVTTLAAIRVLAKKNISLDSGIGGHLPSDWPLDSHVAAITFRQLLSHKSGIKDYGNNDQSYDTLKKFFTQSVDATKNTTCQPASVSNPANPINPNDHNPCYSNYNFSIFRVLLPWIDGFIDDPPNRPAKLAAAYIKLVQKHVFEPVGAINVDAKPPTTGPQATGYAFSYKYPGTTTGYDWGDTSLGVGAAGWYLSIDDIAKVLYSLDKNDGRILTSAQWQDMESMKLGWDLKTKGGYRWVEKNGGWGWNGTTISTSIALFGPGVFGALFINSDVLGVGLQNNWQWCKKCQTISFAGNASLGNCPAGGLHDHQGSRNYCIMMNSAVPAGTQDNWRWCNKCQALSFAGNPSLGKCPAGGMHNHADSGNYILSIRASGQAVPQDYQDNFRWCNKCQVLALGDVSPAGPCAEGGQHDHTGSSNYMLGYVVGADTVLYEAFISAVKPITT